MTLHENFQKMLLGTESSNQVRFDRIRFLVSSQPRAHFTLPTFSVVQTYHSNASQKPISIE